MLTRREFFKSIGIGGGGILGAIVGLKNISFSEGHLSVTDKKKTVIMGDGVMIRDSNLGDVVFKKANNTVINSMTGRIDFRAPHSSVTNSVINGADVGVQFHQPKDFGYIHEKLV